MKNLVHAIDRLLALALMLAMTSILLSVIWQVVSRYLLRDPSSGTEELARFLLIWIGILGAAYAYRQKAHLGFNLLMENQSEQIKRIVGTVVEILVILFAGSVMVFGGNELMTTTLELEQISAALGVRMGLIYSVLPISGLMFMLYALINIHNLWVTNEEARI